MGLGKMSLEKQQAGALAPGPPHMGKRERSFELTLPALVTGVDATGRDFQEQTEIMAISSQEACFLLSTRLHVGSRLILALDVPRTLILERPLRLSVSGTVGRLRQDHPEDDRQHVFLELDGGFKISPGAALP